MNERSRSKAPQPLARIFLAVNLLLCLLILGLVDDAVSAGDHTTLWVSGGALLVLMAPLFWLAKRARGGGERFTVPAGPGWGVELDENALEKYATGPTVKMEIK